MVVYHSTIVFVNGLSTALATAGDGSELVDAIVNATEITFGRSYNLLCNGWPQNTEVLPILRASRHTLR